jgi:hypothetical protein
MPLKLRPTGLGSEIDRTLSALIITPFAKFFVDRTTCLGGHVRERGRFSFRVGAATKGWKWVPKGCSLHSAGPTRRATSRMSSLLALRRGLQ